MAFEDEDRRAFFDEMDRDSLLFHRYMVTGHPCTHEEKDSDETIRAFLQANVEDLDYHKGEEFLCYVEIYTFVRSHDPSMENAEVPAIISAAKQLVPYEPDPEKTRYHQLLSYLGLDRLEKFEIWDYSVEEIQSELLKRGIFPCRNGDDPISRNYAKVARIFQTETTCGFNT